MSNSSARPFHIPYAEISRTLVARDRSSSGRAAGPIGTRIHRSIRSFARSGSKASN